MQIMHIFRMSGMDNTDLRLLAALEGNAQLTSEKLGDMLHLSPSQVGRRRQRLEAAGYIEGYRARISATRLGLSVQAFVAVQMASHAPALIRTFVRTIESRREITSA